MSPTWPLVRGTRRAGRPAGGSPRWLHRAALVGLVVLAIGMATACGGPTHPVLPQGSVDTCYRAIPTARAALHDPDARMIGIHRVRISKVAPSLPRDARARLPADRNMEVCAVAFRGEFAPGQVELAPPVASGRYAVALVGTKHLQLLATAVLTDLPSALGRRVL